MYIYIYVYIVCVFVCMRVCMCVYTYIYIYIHTHIHIYIYVYRARERETDIHIHTHYIPPARPVLPCPACPACLRTWLIIACLSTHLCTQTERLKQIYASARARARVQPLLLPRAAWSCVELCFPMMCVTQVDYPTFCPNP